MSDDVSGDLRSGSGAVAARPIDLGRWTRRETFQHYRERVPCTYAITVEVDVSATVEALRRAGRKTYLAQIRALSSIVNRREEFRMTLDEHGAPAIWDVLHPAFTVFNPERETFASVWSSFDEDFSTFHDAAADVLARYRSATSMFPQQDVPENVFDVSSLPWTSFTGFSLQIRDGWEHLRPVFTIGRHRESDGRTLMPLSIQIHHAAADGFHTARFAGDLQALFAEPTWVGA
ncbi:CatA-like O-acetyltransferase [Microbacterium sp. ZW T5_45]|uniref:CatA-like O-acetyltransferase n=1 Tax=Microbacterium sp. ZW T5_45 TaxID=3378080 RepID=UPI003854891C